MPKKAIISDKAKSEIVLLLKNYVDGVINLDIKIKSRMKDGQKSSLLEGLNLSLGAAFGREKNYNHRPVTKECEQLLVDASNLILKKTGSEARVSFSHVCETLKEELRDEVLYGDHKKKSFYRVLDNALERLGEKVNKNALYIFPVIYTYNTVAFRFEFGPLVFTDMGSFHEEHQSKNFLSDEKINDIFEKQYGEAWEAVKKRAKHVAMVHVQGYELKKGEIVARRAVEFFLNVLRLSFKWDKEFHVKVLDQNVETAWTPSFVILDEGKTNRSLSGMRSEHLHVIDGVESKAISALSDCKHILSAIMDGMVRNSASQSIIMQKIEYASFLMMTAFQQGSVRIATVNFVAALETMACLSDTAKKDVLADRCSNVILDLDEDERLKVATSVRRAYDVRNSVVHGDAFQEDDYWQIFRDLEKWMLQLFLSYVDLLTHIQFTQHPKSGKKLRQAAEDHFS